MVLAAVGQFCATSNVLANLEACKTIVTRAAAQGAKVVCLPEASDYIASNAEEGRRLVESRKTNTLLQGLQESAKEHGVHVSVGIHEKTDDPKRVSNAHVWLYPDGDHTQIYRKLHLYDVDIPNGPIIKESNSTVPGTKLIPPFETPVGKVGMAICYDMRFPELALRLRSLGASCLLYPSAFAVRTGAAHWETLLRARAIDTQCYVLAAAQVGKHDKEGKRQSYGHAMIVDPWGSVLARCHDVDSEPTFCVADISEKHIESIRRNMPLWEQRRTDVFGERGGSKGDKSGDDFPTGDSDRGED
ncbi:carbon-nitrogen hydrolase [Saitoella complicata NRRL Y-17804]|nr:carbon-nitrogen hydrolase [Saitoella complicata NRRL Y-17804]ODQ50950.1 carbon-nitrogen hydrolase [Saitoella complicata NRRL Y-17804]